MNLFCVRSQSDEKLILVRKDTGEIEEGLKLNSTNIISLRNVYDSETLGEPLKIEAQ